MINKYFLQLCGSPFHFLYNALWTQKPFVLKSNLAIFSLVVCSFGIISKKPLTHLRSWGLTSMFSPKSYIVLALKFMSLIRCDLNFVQWEVEVPLYSFACAYSVIHHRLLKILFFPAFILAPLLKINWSNLWIYFCTLHFIALIYLSILMPVVQSLDYCDCEVGFVIRKCESPNFFFKIVMAILGLLHFYMNFQISLSVRVFLTPQTYRHSGSML